MTNRSADDVQSNDNTRRCGNTSSVVWQFFVRKSAPQLPMPPNTNTGSVQNPDSATDNWKAQAVCTLCSTTISLGSKILKNQTTSSLLSHLRSKHAKELGEAEAKKKELSVSETNKKQARLTDATIWSSKWRIDSPQAIEVHKAIMDMIVADMQPLSIVEDSGFQRFVKQAWPKYELPSRKFFSTKLPAVYDIVVEKLKARLPSDGWLSFGTDGWTSQNGEYSFESLTVHWLDECYKPQSAVLEVSEILGRHTGDNLLQLLRANLEKWQIDQTRVHTVVTDSGANIVKVCQQVNIVQSFR